MDLREGESETRGWVAQDTVVVRRRRLGRTIGLFLAGLVVVLLLTLLGLWLGRKPIAENIIARELERRGVKASYSLDRIGLRTQRISNLVIGDPARPDLTAKSAQVEMRILIDGGVEVFRIVATGVRLRGKLVGDRVTWGEVDKLLPRPTVPATPFKFPNMAVELHDATVALATVYGPIGFAVEGRGNLTGGFRGEVAASSPGLAIGECRVDRPRARFEVAILARRPHLTGPAAAPVFACPGKRIAISNARVDFDSDFNEAFSSFDGRATLSTPTLIAGPNALANLIAKVSFKGTPQNANGRVNFAAQNARLAAILADATRFDGRYNLAVKDGRLAMVGNYEARNAVLPPAIASSIASPLAAAAKSPIGPLTDAIATSLTRTAKGFDATGSLRLVNFPGGGAVRVETANAAAPTGERIQVAGRDGVTYYWPSGKVRIDSRISTGGGGLPSGWVDLQQPRGGGPASGEAQFTPYAVGGARLALDPVRFTGARDGLTRVTTTALLDGPFKGGRVVGLQVPIDGSFGGAGGVSFGRSCLDTRFQALSVGALRLGPANVPLCPIGRPMVARRPGGPLQIGAQAERVALSGQLGKSPARIVAGRARLLGVDRFDVTELGLRFGKPDAPVLLEVKQLDGRIGKALTGTFAGGSGVIGKVPLGMADARGRWQFDKSLVVDGALTVSDRSDKMKFRPLASDNVHFVLARDRITTTGTLRHPGTGTAVTDLEIVHNLANDQGHATLDVRALRFSLSGLQPDDLTPLTDGVIALVDGTVRGQGRIAWTGTRVTSTGDFSTDATNLAAAFGPVTGIAGTIHFTDLLGLETAPSETVRLATVNTGILVENGVVHYQLLPGQLVSVERGEWPFMGGQLVLRETILNFGKPTPKRLTFEVVGLDAKLLVESFGFKEVAATGTFDGVLPMIFDDAGGRIVGGRLDSREPGGSLAYQGVMSKANTGLFGGIVFDALRDLRFHNMIVRLDGDLAGEFASRLTIDQVALGNTSTQRFLRSVNKIPFKFNVSIKGPFRALIGTAKSFNDPRATIRDALPEPIANLPDDAVTITKIDDSQQQTQTPVKDQVTRTKPNER